MRMLLLILIGTVALSASATDARADAMDVTYLVSGTASVVGFGPIGALAGPLIVEYAATGGVGSGTAGNIVSGPANIFWGSLSLPLSFTGFGATVTGWLAGTVHASAGALTGGGGLSLPLQGTLFGSVRCTGFSTGCSAFGLPTGLTVGAALFLSNALHASLGALPPLATIAFNSGIIGTFHGANVSTQLTATEVSRHYVASVPEPSALPLLALGMGVALLAAARRIRWFRR